MIYESKAYESKRVQRSMMTILLSQGTYEIHEKRAQSGRWRAEEQVDLHCPLKGSIARRV
jgi:hypothetical protein